MSGRWPAERGMPMAAKLTNVEITQARNLHVEFLAVRRRRTDLHPRHALRLASRRTVKRAVTGSPGRWQRRPL